MVLVAAFGFVSTLGLSSQNPVVDNTLNMTAFYKAGNCQMTASGLPGKCNSDLGVSIASAPTVFTFGFFVWVLNQMITVIPNGIATLGNYVTYYFGPVGAVAAAGLGVVMVFTIWEIVGNRNTRPE